MAQKDGVFLPRHELPRVARVYAVVTRARRNEQRWVGGLCFQVVVRRVFVKEIIPVISVWVA